MFKAIIIICLILLTAFVIFLSIASRKVFDLAIDSRKSKLEDIDIGDDETTRYTYEKLKRNESIFESLPFETLHMKNGDGHILTGYFVPAKQPSDKLVILAHGFTLKAKHLGVLAEYYYSQGFNVFAADARAHGDSEGIYRGMGWLDKKDYLGWMKLLIERLGSSIQILLYGPSMGGATVMMLSGEEGLPTNVKCIIEDCGYTSVKEEFTYQVKQLMPKLPTKPVIFATNILNRIVAKYSFSEASALNQVKKTKVPIFFIHGAEDTYTPTEMAHQLYDVCQSEKELWIVNGAGHGKAYDVNPEEYKTRITKFYSKYLK